MNTPLRLRVPIAISFAVMLLAFYSSAALAQSVPEAAASGLPQPKNWTAAEDHQNMMDQLGIKALRPGPSGNESAPNHANYDESVEIGRAHV